MYIHENILKEKIINGRRERRRDPKVEKRTNIRPWGGKGLFSNQKKTNVAKML